MKFAIRALKIQYMNVVPEAQMSQHATTSE